MQTDSKEFLTALIVGYLGIIAAGYYIFCENYDAISAWAVAWTGAVILWYTWETMQLRKAAHAQRELQLRPFVVVERLEHEFKLRNLGQGTALNVKIGDVEIDPHEQIVVRFPEVVPILPCGGEKAIGATSSHGGKASGDFFTPHLDPCHATMDLEINVVFQNVEMKSYQVSERVRPGSLEILGVSEA